MSSTGSPSLLLLGVIGLSAVSALGKLVELALHHLPDGARCVDLCIGLLHRAPEFGARVGAAAFGGDPPGSAAPFVFTFTLLVSLSLLFAVDCRLSVLLALLRQTPADDPAADHAAAGAGSAGGAGADPLSPTTPRHALVGADPPSLPWQRALRSPGEYARVDPLSLEPPSLRCAYESLHELVVIEAHEEYDALRALQSRNLHVEKTATWMVRHREWVEKIRPSGRPLFPHMSHTPFCHISEFNSSFANFSLRPSPTPLPAQHPPYPRPTPALTPRPNRRPTPSPNPALTPP